jgi:hypothetical protein
MLNKIIVLIEFYNSIKNGFVSTVNLKVYQEHSSKYRFYHTESFGVGYDLRSDALSRALNKSKAIKNWLLSQGINFSYGADSSGFKEGGVGLEPILNIFIENGFLVSELFSHNQETKAYFIFKK